MKTKNILAIHTALSLLLRDKACSGHTAYRVHRTVADLGKTIDSIREAYEAAVAAEKNGQDEKALDELRQRIWANIMENEENMTVPKFAASGIDWGRGDPGALQELIRQDLTEGEPVAA